MYTYNPKKIEIALGTHRVTGIADDSFVTIEPNGDGVVKKVGCDGEVVRSVSPDDTYNVKIVVFQGSATNSWLEAQLKKDRDNGKGTFPVTIKDLIGTMVFNAKEAWVVRSAPRGFGKEAGSREWEIQTGSATIAE